MLAFTPLKGDNAEFRYRLSPQNTASVPFDVDSIRGAIYVSEMLDFESTTHYDFEVQKLSSTCCRSNILQVEVYEVETIEMRSDTAMVHIFIIDVNDNPPMFAFDTYTVSVREEQSAGAFVATIEVHYPVYMCLIYQTIFRQQIWMLVQLVY